MTDERKRTEEPDQDSADDAARDKFIDDLNKRGEVVPKDAELPPGATHDVDEDEKDGVKLRRRRFSAY